MSNLIHLISFQSLLSVDDDTDNPDDSVFYQVQSLFGHLMESKLQYYVPENFWKVFHPVTLQIERCQLFGIWLHSSSSDNSLLFINSRLMPLPRTYARNIFTILHMIRMLRIVICIISRDLLVLIVWTVSPYSYLSV